MSRGKGLKVVLLGLAGLALVAIVAGLLAVKPLARRLALEKAREHGVELTFSDLSLGLGHVTLDGCEFSLVGLPAIHGKISRLEVTTHWLDAVGIGVEGAEIRAEGSALALVLGVVEWTKKYPATYRLPANANNVGFEWRKDPSRVPWLKLEAGAVQRSGKATSFHADKTVVGECAGPKKQGCADVGRVGATWTADDAVVMLGFGEDDLARAPVRVDVKHSLAKPTADISLASTPLETLADPFGVALPVKDVKASAKVHLEMPKGRASGAISGTVSASLEGYVPPHPRELDGFVFGNVTTLDTKLVVDEKRERVDLSETKVTAGAFKLAGDGNLIRDQGRAKIHLALKGSLPCDALAGAAAGSYLGKTFGGIAGAFAKQLVGGNVGVTVVIDAVSDDLEHAKVARSIGIGCGLRPLSPSAIDLSKLPVPPIPSNLPPLPKIDFGLEPPSNQAAPQ